MPVNKDAIHLTLIFYSRFVDKKIKSILYFHLLLILTWLIYLGDSKRWLFFCIYNDDPKGTTSELKLRNAKNVSKNIGQATLFFNHKIMSCSSSLLKTLRGEYRPLVYFGQILELRSIPAHCRNLKPIFFQQDPPACGAKAYIFYLIEYY